MPLRRLIFLSGLVLAVAALSPAAALGAAKGTDRPVLGEGSGTSTVNLVARTALGVGTARISHLGKGTYQINSTSSPITSTVSRTEGTITFVAANGDQIFGTFTGTRTITATGTASTRTVTITGGTGRFADASGTLTLDGTTDNTSIVGGTLTDRFTFTLRGQISY